VILLLTQEKKYLGLLE